MNLGLRVGIAAAICACVSFGSEARAQLVVEGTGLYLTHTSSYSSENKSKDIVAGAFLAGTYRKRYTIGVEYNYTAAEIDAGGTGAAFSGATYGFRAGAAFGKGKWFHVNVVYYPYVTGTLEENGAESGKLSGWGWRAEVAVTPSLSESTYVGIKLAYRQMKFGSLVDPSNTKSDVSYSDAHIFPALVWGKRFN